VRVHDKEMPMNVMIHVILCVVAVLVVVGCQVATRENGNGGPKAQAFVGALQGGMMAIGGETSGWLLQQDGKEPIELQIDAVGHETLEPFDGQRVKIIGHESHKQYVERGRVPVIVVKGIEAAH
jgi:hypothetical protein